jgi:hypothetical protein
MGFTPHTKTLSHVAPAGAVGGGRVVVSLVSLSLISLV